jgi:hypothetical protein
VDAGKNLDDLARVADDGHQVAAAALLALGED